VHHDNYLPSNGRSGKVASDRQGSSSNDEASHAAVASWERICSEGIDQQPTDDK
jgi:hypothetical protein